MNCAVDSGLLLVSFSFSKADYGSVIIENPDLKNGNVVSV